MSSSEPTHLLYEFGPFRLETEKNMLFRGADEQVRVGPSEFRILLYLIENRARAVSRDELYNKFLSKDDPKKVVEESNVYVKISALRKALGEKVGENKYIQTVEDTYRFVAKDLAVTAVAPGTNAADPATPTRAARAGNIVVGDSKDGMDTFEGWLVGPGKFITMFLLVYVIATVILSVEGVDRQWEFTTLAVSIAHIIFLLVIALPYPLSGPKEFYAVEELTRGGVLNEEVRFSTGYDDPREWGDDSEIAQKSLERYKIYWRGVLFAWLLLYGCLTLVVHPYLDLNCRIDTTRFCKSNVKDPADLAAALKDERVPSSRYLRDLLPAGARKELDDYDGSLPPSLSLQQDLIDGLNQRLRDCCLYSEERFAKDKLPEETRRLVGRQLEGERLISFNRSLLTAAYPLSHPDESKQFWSVVVNIGVVA